MTWVVMPCIEVFKKISLFISLSKDLFYEGLSILHDGQKGTHMQT